MLDLGVNAFVEYSPAIILEVYTFPKREPYEC